MPDVYNRLMASRFADAARRLLGEDVELGTFAPELSMTIGLADNRDEYSALVGERLAIGRTGNIAAGAGNFGFASLQNPPGSGIIASVVAAYHIPTTTNNMFVTLANFAALGTAVGAGNAVLRDSGLWRTGSNNPPTLQLFTGTNAAITGITIWRYSVTALTVNQLNPWNNVVLRPGSMLILWNNVVNEAIPDAGFAWRERSAGRPEELLLGV